MASRPIVINITGDDSNLRKTLKGAANKVEGFAKKVGALGIKAGAAFGAVSGAVAVGGVKAFSEFEAGMREVLTLIPEAGAEAFGELGDQVKQFSKEFGVLPEKTIPALYQALSAGVPKDNVFEFLEVAQKAAKGGVTDLETAVDGLSSVINAYGGPAMMDMTRASDLLFTAVKLGKTDFTQLSNSIFQVAPIASAVGVPFENLTAAFANLTAQGVPTSVAATQLKGVLAELAKEGTKADTAFRDLNGVGLAGFLENGGTFEEALMSLKDGADAAGISTLDLFGSVEAGQAVLALTADGGEKFAETLEAMGDSAGATTTAFETMDSGLAANMDKIKANLKVLSIEVGEKLAPFIERFTGALIAGFGDLDKHLATARDTAIDVAKKIKEKAVPILDGIADTFTKVADAAMSVYETIYEYLAPGIEDLYDNIERLVRDGLEKIVEVFERIQWGEVFDTLATAAENARAAVMDFVRDVPNKMREARDKLLEIIDEMNKKIDSFRAFIKRNADQLLLLAGAIGGVVVALGLYKVALLLSMGATAAWSAITTAATAVGLAFIAVQAALAAPLLIVIGLLAAVAGALVVAYFRFEEVREIVDSVGRFFMNYFWPTVKAVFEFIIDIIKVWVTMFVETAKLVKNLISGDFQGAFDNLKNLVGIAIDAVVAFFTALPGKLLATLPALILGLFKIYKAFLLYIKEKVGNIIDDVVGFFLDLPGRLLSAGVKIASSLLDMGIDFGKSVIDGLIEGIRRFGGMIASTIMSMVPSPSEIASSIASEARSIAGKVGGGLVDAGKSIFGFSEGGIVTKPTLGIIAEAGEAEAVIPLSKMGQMGGITINIQTGVGDPVAIGDDIVSALTAWQRSNGNIPLTTSAA